ncbi:hypothetical protein ABIC37_005138 [Priestia megaterium]|uniref:6-pyruvoyl-tetrahydropterin synthase-related protein n=1 Tax=Priestia megaterium TaxID=1404 RepID=UPI000471BE42|nr:6-pyruvoyl-tetrahydropterin synthase-related protein [Priestia megaterium]
MNKKYFYRIGIFLTFVLLSLWCSKPYFVQDILPGGHDLIFHLLRIEGLTDSVLKGNLIPYINTNYLNGYGYPVDLFYSNFFIYIAVAFRAIGFSLLTSYKLLIFVSTLLTLFVTYVCVKPLTKSVLASLIASILYSLSSYRLTDIYVRASLGEVLAFIFFPVCVLGIYYIFYTNNKRWYILALGMSGLLLTHMLSAVMMCVLIAMCFLISIKKLIVQRQRIYSLFFAGALTVGLCSFFIFPMIEQLLSATLHVEIGSPFKVSDTPLKPFDLLVNTINNDSWKANPGILLIILPLIRLFLRKSTKERYLADIYLVSGLIFLIMTTTLVPWSYLEHTPLAKIQFPWRFLTLSTLFLSLAGSMYVKIAIDQNKIDQYKALIVPVICIILSLHIFQAVDIHHPWITKSEHTLNSLAIGSGQEYLPSETTTESISKKPTTFITDNKNAIIKNYKKDDTHVSLDFKVDKNTTITLPLIYYKGYYAEVITQNKHKVVPISTNKEGILTVDVHNSGTLNIYYKGTNIQKVSIVLSILCFFFLIFLFIQNRKNKKINIDLN